MSTNPTLRPRDEVNQQIHLGEAVFLAAQNLDRFAIIPLFPVEDTMGMLDRSDRFVGKTATFQTDRIDRPHFGRVTVGDHKGRHILYDLRATAGDGMGPDTTELMHRRETAHDCIIADRNMTGKGTVIRENNVIAHHAVMSDVTIGEEISVASDDRIRPWSGAPVDGTKFPKGISLADLQISRFTLILQILRALSDRGVGVELIIRPDLTRPGESHMILQPAAVAEPDTGINHTIRTNNDAVTELNAQLDNRSRMNLVSHLITRDP